MAPIYQLGVSDILIYATSIWLLTKIVKHVRRSIHATPLRGPPSQSFVFGAQRQILESNDHSALYEKWAAEYGSVFSVPGAFGRRRVVLCDPKAVAHFYARETFVYVQTVLVRTAVENLV